MENERQPGAFISHGVRMTEQIRFDDGSAYERYMGRWSRLVGDAFLDWVAPEPGLRWLDVGCGSGAFTEMIVNRYEPVSVHGIDPSEEQLEYARSRPALRNAELRSGDAMELPFARASFDAAVMPLVIFFVPDPAVGVAEMVRVVASGGIVAAYGWDLEDGGFPYEPLLAAIRETGAEVPEPPNPHASRTEVLRELWTGAGLEAVETREIVVRRTFAGFDDYWETIRGAPSFGSRLAATDPRDLARLEARMREILPVDAEGGITCEGRANAVKGRVRG